MVLPIKIHQNQGPCAECRHYPNIKVELVQGVGNTPKMVKMGWATAGTTRGGGCSRLLGYRLGEARDYKRLVWALPVNSCPTRWVRHLRCVAIPGARLFLLEAIQRVLLLRRALHTSRRQCREGRRHRV